jgi:hypothetical protein
MSIYEQSASVSQLHPDSDADGVLEGQILAILRGKCGANVEGAGPSVRIYLRDEIGATIGVADGLGSPVCDEGGDLLYDGCSLEYLLRDGTLVTTGIYLLVDDKACNPSIDSANVFPFNRPSAGVSFIEEAVRSGTVTEVGDSLSFPVPFPVRNLELTLGDVVTPECGIEARLEIEAPGQLCIKLVNDSTNTSLQNDVDGVPVQPAVQSTGIE